MKINEVTKKIEPSKPRNFVAKNAMSTTSGAGAHRDKKKELKQGKEKHKGKQYDLAEIGLDEEGENIAGTITSVTPDGKQVTMKKPDGTEVTTDASAFLPGPNNTVTINQPSPGDELKPGTVVQAAPQGMGEEINDEEDPDLMGSGHNHDIGGDATDEFIDDVRDKEFEKHNAFGALSRIKQLAGVKETSQPENVVDPEEPADQEVPAQEPAQQAPAEPVRKPRYKWQQGPLPTQYGHPGWEAGTESERDEWYKSDKSKEYSAAHKAHIAAQQAAMIQHAGVSPKDFDTSIDEFPNPYYKEGGPDDEEDPNFEPEIISIGVDYDYKYHGKYYAATQIDPAEYPELEVSIHRVIDLDTGEDITKKVDLGEVEKYIEDEIPSWEDEEREARDQAAIDRYEANRDYYDESMDRIRKLSGL